MGGNTKRPSTRASRSKVTASVGGSWTIRGDDGKKVARAKKTSKYSANVPKRMTGSKPKPLPAMINGRLLYKEVPPTATAWAWKTCES
jgi:hypothetical protein